MNKKLSNDSLRKSRREFAKTMATTLLAAPVVATLAQAQTPQPSPRAPETRTPPNPQPSPSPQTPSPTAEAYTQVARARFGEHLSAEELEQVKKDLEGNVRVADRLRTFKLQNGDEPDFVFSA
ncbi:MAG TPA: hypothetical protein VK619_07995 [Pyrinomonadaceae bacterium]|nr:hypothetical protein [Pyrinomonadaceae bacterium]